MWYSTVAVPACPTEHQIACASASITPTSRSARPRSPQRLTPPEHVENLSGAVEMLPPTHITRNCASCGGGPGSWPTSSRKRRADGGAAPPPVLLDLTCTSPAP